MGGGSRGGTPLERSEQGHQAVAVFQLQAVRGDEGDRLQQSAQAAVFFPSGVGDDPALPAAIVGIAMGGDPTFLAEAFDQAAGLSGRDAEHFGKFHLRDAVAGRVQQAKREKVFGRDLFRRQPQRNIPSQLSADRPGRSSERDEPVDFARRASPRYFRHPCPPFRPP